MHRRSFQTLKMEKRQRKTPNKFNVLQSQGELDGLMLQHPHLVHSRQQRPFISQQTSHLQHSSGIQLPQPMQSHYHHPSQQHQQPSSHQMQQSGKLPFLVARMLLHKEIRIRLIFGSPELWHACLDSRFTGYMIFLFRFR